MGGMRGFAYRLVLCKSLYGTFLQPRFPQGRISDAADAGQGRQGKKGNPSSWYRSLFSRRLIGRAIVMDVPWASEYNKDKWIKTGPRMQCAALV